MINVVELIPDNEFMDVDQLKSAYLSGIRDFLAGQGYDVSHVDRSEWYSFERKLLVDTNAPERLLDTAVDTLNKKLKNAYGVVVQ
jgi:hypothetical protein